MAANVPSGLYESIVVATPVLKARRVRRGVVGCVVVLAMIVALSFVLKPKDRATFSLNASGAATKIVERLRFEVEVAAGASAPPISGVLDVNAGLMKMDLDGAALGVAAGTTLSAYLDLHGLVMFVSADGLGQQLPSGKTWVRVDLRKVAAANGVDLSDVVLPGTDDPLGAVALVDQAKNVKDIARETIFGGVAAEHFSFDVKTDDALKVAGVTRKKLLGDSGVTLPDVVTYEVWVDIHNYIRQIKFAIAVADQTFDYVARYTEINPKVTLALPAADQSVDISELSGN
jgi:hypothetical protein